jgi:hypothetical protein
VVAWPVDVRTLRHAEQSSPEVEITATLSNQPFEINASR